MNRPEQDGPAERGVQQSSSVSNELRQDADLKGYANTKAEFSKQGTADGVLSQLQITDSKPANEGTTKCGGPAFPPREILPVKKPPAEPAPSGDPLLPQNPLDPRQNSEKIRDLAPIPKCGGGNSDAPLKPPAGFESQQKMTAEQAEQESKERVESLQQVKQALRGLKDEYQQRFLDIPGEGKNRWTATHVDFLRINSGIKAAIAMQTYIDLTRTDMFK